jgi:hypothetical protein
MESGCGGEEPLWPLFMLGVKFLGGESGWRVW